MTAKAEGCLRSLTSQRNWCENESFSVFSE